ncbi:MAG: ROK family protein [Clostridia bacterium]|nr:ROK family protein [Clostridia bacterium]
MITKAMATDLAVGVDIGGTKIAAGVVDSHGNMLSRARALIASSEADPNVTTEQVAGLIRSAEEQAMGIGVRPDGMRRRATLPVGIGIPAVLDSTRREVVWAPNIPGFRGFGLVDALKGLLGREQIAMDFDGNAAVAGEAWIGAAAGKENVVFLIIGTGVGAGLILNGRLFRGASGMPGGVGWFALDPDAVCEALERRTPHFEAMCAGPGIVRIANTRARSGPGLGSSCKPATPEYSDARQLFSAYEAGDEHAACVLMQAARYVGMGVANIVSTLNPDVVVIGGGVGLEYCRHDDLFKEILNCVSGLAQPAAAAAVRVGPAALGPAAGVVGAAKIALDTFCATDERV